MPDIFRGSDRMLGRKVSTPAGDAYIAGHVRLDPVSGEPAETPTGAESDQVQGNAANMAADVGNPVKTGGVYRVNAPTLTDGQRGDTQLDNRGNTQVTLASGSIIITGESDNADGGTVASSVNGLKTIARNRVFNGSTWDRLRGDTSGMFVAGNVFWTESTTGLAANATLNGALRSSGGTASGIGSRHSFFVVEAFSDVAGGTLFIDKSVDGTTWRQVGSIALTAATSVSLKVPVSAASYRGRVTNGGTAQTAALVTTSYAPN